MVWVSACKRVEDPSPIIGPTYFPIELEKYIIYSVAELNHDAFLSKTDTSLFLQRETIDALIEGSITETYKLRIETSIDSGITWKFTHFATIQKNVYSAERTENNERKVKLSFPFKDRKSWDANELNSQPFQTARLRKIGEADSLLNGIIFFNTVTVDLGNDQDPFFTNIEQEVYADSIGLIERIFADYETQPGKYKDGTEYIKTFYQSNW